MMESISCIIVQRITDKEEKNKKNVALGCIIEIQIEINNELLNVILWNKCRQKVKIETIQPH